MLGTLFTERKLILASSHNKTESFSVPTEIWDEDFKVGQSINPEVRDGLYSHPLLIPIKNGSCNTTKTNLQL